jgi:hypothetical protein
MPRTRKVPLATNQHRTADELLPVKNMADWGCTSDVIKAPQYADRAFVLCSQVRVQPYQKIAGQINDGTAPPTMLDKQSHKTPSLTVPMSKSTPAKSEPDWGAGEEKQTPYPGRKKLRK